MELKDLVNEPGHEKLVEVLKLMKARQPLDKVLLKAAEESQELALGIIQHLTKDPDNSDNILEEMVDVYIQLSKLFNYFPEDKIKTMFEKKINKTIQKNLYK